MSEATIQPSTPPGGQSTKRPIWRWVLAGFGALVALSAVSSLFASPEEPGGAAETEVVLGVTATPAPTTTPSRSTTQAPTDSAETETPEVDVVGSGMYITGELAPGTYRVIGYWARLDATGDIIDNALTTNGGLSLLHVDGSEDIVEISGEAAPLVDLPVVDPVAMDLTDGVYLVGIDVAPGRYRVTGASQSYIARLDSQLDIIDNALSDGSVVMTIAPSDYAVEINGRLEPLP